MQERALNPRPLTRQNSRPAGLTLDQSDKACAACGRAGAACAHHSKNKRRRRLEWLSLSASVCSCLPPPPRCCCRVSRLLPACLARGPVSSQRLQSLFIIIIARGPIVSCSSGRLRVRSDRSKTSSTNQWPPTTTNNNHRSSTVSLLFLPHACASCVAIPSSMVSCATPRDQATRSAAPFTAANASPKKPTNAANAAPSCSKTEPRSFPTEPSQQWLMDFKFDAVIDLMDALGKDNVDNCSTIAKPTAPRDLQCASTVVDVGHSIGSLNTNLNAAIVS